MDEDDLEAFDDVDLSQEPDPDLETPDPDLGRDEPQDDAPASRGDRDYGRLREERRQAREEADQLRRELDDMRARNTQQSQETPAQREQRLAAMDPYERDLYIRDERLARLEGQLQATQHQALETTDAISFRALCAENPLVNKLKDDVEKVFKENKAKGTVVPREVIASYLLGQQIMKKGAKAVTKAATEAAGRKAAQAGKPTGSRGDAPASGKREVNEQEARRQRLENVRL